jgi:hypothetical protein
LGLGSECIDLGGEIAPGRLFQVAQKTVNLRPGQKALQDSAPAFTIRAFRDPGVFQTDIPNVFLVQRVGRSQNGEIGIEEYLGVRVAVRGVRFRFQDQRGNQRTIGKREVLTELSGVVGTARSLSDAPLS